MTSDLGHSSAGPTQASRPPSGREEEVIATGVTTKCSSFSSSTSLGFEMLPGASNAPLLPCCGLVAKGSAFAPLFYQRGKEADIYAHFQNRKESLWEQRLLATLSRECQSLPRNVVLLLAAYQALPQGGTTKRGWHDSVTALPAMMAGVLGCMPPPSSQVALLLINKVICLSASFFLGSEGCFEGEASSCLLPFLKRWITSCSERQLAV